MVLFGTPRVSSFPFDLFVMTLLFDGHVKLLECLISLGVFDVALLPGFGAHVASLSVSYGQLRLTIGRSVRPAEHGPM